MKSSVLLPWAFAAIVTPILMTAQTTPDSKPLAQQRKNAPARDAYIVKYDVLDNGGGPLRILYSDETVLEIQKERGRVKDGNATLTQDAFSEVQVANDRQHIGWLADYLICAQSYPCAVAFGIFHAGSPPRYIEPDATIWEWAFLEQGKQIVLHVGLPHGDVDGHYLLYDSGDGRARGRFTPGQGLAPDWVRPLEERQR